MPAVSVPIERSPVFFESAAEAAKEGKKALARRAGEARGVTTPRSSSVINAPSARPRSAVRIWSAECTSI